MPVHRRWVPLLLLAGPLLGAPVFAGGSHRLLGTWDLDVATLERPDPPGRVTMRLADAGQGTYHFAIEIVARDGKILFSGGTDFTPGADAVTVTGSEELDKVCFSMPNSRTLVLAAGLGKQPAHTRVYTLTDDGRRMTETRVGHVDGTPMMRATTWNRRAPAKG